MIASTLQRAGKRLTVACILSLVSFTNASETLPQPTLSVSPEMKQFLVDHNVSKRQAPLVRMQRIVDGLYGGEYGFVYAARENLTATEAYAMRRGNCVSFAMVFVSLAREVGLDAQFNQVEYSPVWQEIGGILVETSHINAIVNIGGRQYVVEGIPEFTEIASRSRNPIPDTRVFSHYYNNTGLVELAKGDPEKGEELIKKAIEIDPTNGTAWQNLGLCEFRKGNISEGERALLEASRLNEQSSSACFLLAQFYERTDKEGLAERFAKLGKKRSKQNPFYHYYMSRNAMAEGKVKQSIRHLEKAVRLLPEYSLFEVELAKLKQDSANDGA